MPSPFVGMDPYIEACGLWGDFHDTLITEIKRSLARRVPERYFVRIGERSYLVLIESEGKKERSFLPDVSVSSPRRTPERGRRKKGAGAAEVTLTRGQEALTLRAFIDERFREVFVEVFEAGPEQRLVTSIEVLSPSNKRPHSEGREEYLRKRQACLLGETNLVEIDLLRTGERMPMLDPWPDSPYVIMAARAFRPQSCKVWRASYRAPLPTIQVPLLEPDADVLLDLQPLVETVYEVSRYAQTIDYSRPLLPPLPAADAAWLAGRLREAKPAGRAKR